MLKIPFVTAQVDRFSDGITLQSDPSTNLARDSAIEKVCCTEGVQIRFARMVLENSYGAETCSELTSAIKASKSMTATNFNPFIPTKAV